jgi:hypothetical protein
LQRPVGVGKAAARKTLHGRVLLQMDQGAGGLAWPDAKVGEALGVYPNTIGGIRQRFVEQGLEAALNRKKRPTHGRQPVFDGRAKAHLIALRCGEPPKGRRGRRRCRRERKSRFCRNTYNEKIARSERTGKPRRALLSLTTGAGKTFIAVHLLKRFNDVRQLKRALFVCDRDELRAQGLGALQNVFGAALDQLAQDPDADPFTPLFPRTRPKRT